MTSEVSIAQTDSDVLQGCMTVGPLYDNVEELLDPLLGVGVVQVLQQLLPPQTGNVGTPQPDHYHPVQPLLQT